MNIQSTILYAFIISVFFSCVDQKKVADTFGLTLNLKKSEATGYYQQGDYTDAVAILEGLVQYPQLIQYKRERVSIYYDLACNHALMGNKERALTYLQTAVEYGFANVSHLERDGDLELIRNDRRFLKLIAQIKRQQNLWENPLLKTPFRTNISEHEKIAGLSKLWSEIKYNFINFDLVPEVNLDSLYMEYLKKIRETSSTLEYYRLLQNFCVHLKDGHTHVNYPKELHDQINGRVPIQTRLIEDHVIISEVYDEHLIQKGVTPGDEITHVDGYPALEYADRFVRPYWTSNSKHARNRTIFEYAYLRGPVGKPVTITCKNASDEIFDLKLPRRKRLPLKWEPVVYRQLENGIGYLTIKSFYSDEIVRQVDSVFSKIMKTEALIVDLRENGGGNGRIGWKILGYFTAEPFEIFKWKTRLYRPIWRAWGHREEIYEEMPAMKFADKQTCYDKPVVLLIRPRTASMAENFCMGFRIMKRGKIIGGPSAGSSGTPVFFSLPGGGSAQVVTTRGMYPNGKELTGFGVQPDIEVHPTREDFRSRRDRILEKAVEFLTQSTAL